jgi:hypothetical protein
VRAIPRRPERGTLGLGVETVSDREAAARRAARVEERARRGGVSRGETRRRERERVRRDERIREHFYGAAEVDKYLREGAEWE